MRKLAAACLIIVGIPAALPAAESARVITKENAIRKDCRFFAPVITKVFLNDKLTVVGKSGDWFQVSFKGRQGCIYKGALEQKSFNLSSAFGGKAQSASSDEVALAGKGFNPQVEASYKKSNPDLDFKAVDAIEKNQVSPDELQSFLKEGGLNNER